MVEDEKKEEAETEAENCRNRRKMRRWWKK
jgi:hypothetical protein